MSSFYPIVCIGLFFIMYFYKENRDRPASVCSLILGMGLLFESAFSFFFHTLPDAYLCVVAITVDGLVTLAILKTTFENRVFLGILGGTIITLTFLVGVLNSFPQYRLFIDVLMLFQLLGIMVKLNGRRGILGAVNYLHRSK